MNSLGIHFWRFALTFPSTWVVLPSYPYTDATFPSFTLNPCIPFAGSLPSLHPRHSPSISFAPCGSKFPYSDFCFLVYSLSFSSVRLWHIWYGNSVLVSIGLCSSMKALNIAHTYYLLPVPRMMSFAASCAANLSLSSRTGLPYNQCKARVPIYPNILYRLPFTLPSPRIFDKED